MKMLTQICSVCKSSMVENLYRTKKAGIFRRMVHCFKDIGHTYSEEIIDRDIDVEYYKQNPETDFSLGERNGHPK